MFPHSESTARIILTLNQALAEIERIKSQLLNPRPLRILACSASRATLSLLSTMLNEFYVKTLSSLVEVEEYLQHSDSMDPPLDFIILDEQSESRADELSHFIRSLPNGHHNDLKIVHFFTPTTDGLSGTPALKNDGDAPAGILRLTKPPRQIRLLYALAKMKDLPDQAPSTQPTDNSALKESEALSQRRLYGNVLIAEG